MLILSCFLLCFSARLLIDALWSPAVKWLTSWRCLIMKLSLSHWYPGSGVVLDLSIPDLRPLFYFYTFLMAKFVVF